MASSDGENVFLDAIESFQEKRFAGAASPAAISNAEAKLGVRFPPDYRQFLETLGSGFISFEEFIGLGGDPHLDVVARTLKLREPGRISTFPKNLVPVLSDGGGNYESLDVSRSADDGRCPVVMWLHDGGPDQSPEVIAPNYAEWFLRILQNIRNEGE